MSEYYRPIYQSLPLNHFETPCYVRDLIRDSEQPSVHHNSKSQNTNRHRTLSVRTLRVRELCRHDRDTSPINNQQRNLDAHIGSYIFYEDLYWSNRNNNIRYSLCHRYVTCRDSIVVIIIPSSISLSAILFTCFIIHHTATNSLVTLLARLIMMCITERAQRYLSDTRSEKS